MTPKNNNDNVLIEDIDPASAYENSNSDIYDSEES